MRVLIFGAITLFPACTDKAKPEYDRCIVLEKSGSVLDANDACEVAVKADPSSKSGKLASKKLADMKPDVEHARQMKALDDIIAAKKAEEDRAAQEKRDREAKANAAKQLRAKVKRKYYDEEPDAMCQGKGMPPYKWEYSGGTYQEDRQLAFADGCQAPFVSIDTTFCCPAKPSVW